MVDEVRILQREERQQLLKDVDVKTFHLQIFVCSACGS